MSSSDRNATHAVTKEAVEWFVTIQASRDFPDEMLHRWLAWLEASKVHREEFDALVQVWHQVPTAISRRSAEPSTLDDYDGSISVAEWNSRGKRPRTGLAMGRFWKLTLMAACLAMLTLAALLGTEVLNLFHPREFSTSKGQHMDVRLADGSSITLGADSRLLVDFTPRVRRVQLQGGEAFFHVQTDKRRPFRVLAASGEITAIGTAFNVRSIADRLTVTVTEGVVRLAEPQGEDAGGACHGPASNGGGDAEPLTDQKSGFSSTAQCTTYELARGQQLIYANDGTAPRWERIDAAGSPSWMKGVLVYRNEKLRHVIADIARYTDLDLRVADSAAELVFTGTVFHNRVAEWISALPKVAPVVIEQHGKVLTIYERKREQLHASGVSAGPPKRCCVEAAQLDTK